MTSEAPQIARDAPTAAHRAAHSSTLRHLARLGLLSYALLHLLVAWLALQLAWGDLGLASAPGSGGQRATDSSGAMTILARSPLGAPLLWVLAVGFAGLCVWQAVEVFRHHRCLPDPGPDRRSAVLQLGKTVGTALTYGFLAVSAARVALGARQHRHEEEQTVRGVFAWPGGQQLVVVAGLVVVAIGLYHVRKGLRSEFLQEIDLSTVAPALCTLAHRSSQLGFVLKGVSFVLVGGIVAWAAITFDPEQATGLDGALRAIAAEPYGRWVLTAIAVGLASFAVYCLARARHPVG